VIREAAGDLRRGRQTSLTLTTAALARIARLDGSLRSFITVSAEPALARARQADAELAAGHDRGPLHGVPVSVKDLFATRGILTTGGSLRYRDWVPGANSTAVERLEAAGAVLVGKNNLHELAYGVTSANPHFGAVANPWNLRRSPGGSSGGSAAAVAAGLVHGALGTDTGGSIRIPAAFCGVVGLKPTYGRVSRHGVLPLAYTLDHVGPLAATVRDAALLLNAIAGHDPADPSSSRRPAIDFVPPPACSIRGLRVGIPENFFFERLDPEVDEAVRSALERAQSIGARLKPVRVPDMAACNAVARVIQLAEAAAVLGPLLERRGDLGTDVRALIDQGRLVAATDYLDAQRLRRRYQREFQRLWSEVDCLAAPATPLTAPEIGQTTVRLGGEDEDVRLAATRLVRAINLLGLPALSLPCGVSSSGLPVGLQIIGPPFDEASVLILGAALEDAGLGIAPCPML
jgi:aspartyl-tRNA(Asn)/glutamyl-tRNA(Gln) amidotransferase subunit A